MNPMTDNFTRPTTNFWQTLWPADHFQQPPQPPYRYGYPVRLPDGQYLELPLRPLPDDPRQAVASFIANHAAFPVIDTLAGFMADLARPLQPQMIVGLPTLGLAFAPLVAQLLGFTHYTPLGYSRKYWYRDELSVPVRSLTTPGAGKALFIDPNVVERVRGRRVVIIDDAISSGQTAVAALKLMELTGAEAVAMVVAMTQGERWRARLQEISAGWPQQIYGVFHAPRFRRSEQGWTPE
jgi:adenine/guanine phosphoribosyltransferase-like PRPP-binding protein